MYADLPFLMVRGVDIMPGVRIVPVAPEKGQGFGRDSFGHLKRRRMFVFLWQRLARHIGSRRHGSKVGNVAN